MKFVEINSGKIWSVVYDGDNVVRPSTLNELRKMEIVRNFLIEQGAVDLDGIKDIAEND